MNWMLILMNINSSCLLKVPTLLEMEFIGIIIK